MSELHETRSTALGLLLVVALVAGCPIEARLSLQPMPRDSQQDAASVDRAPGRELRIPDSPPRVPWEAGAPGPAWARSIGGSVEPSKPTALESARPSGIAVDSKGNIYVAVTVDRPATFGSTVLSPTTTSGALIKLASSGELLWAKLVVSAGGYDSIYWIGVDGTDRVYIGGLKINGGYVAKLDADGQQLWSSSVPMDLTHAGAVDAGGYASVTGSGGGVVRLDPAGNTLWSAAPSGYGAQGRGVALDGAGNSYVTGSFGSIVTFGAQSLYASGTQDIYVAKVDSTGKWAWAVSAGGNGLSSSSLQMGDADAGYDITSDSAGNLTITGLFVSAASFGSRALTAASTSGPEIFAAGLDPGGTFLWARSGGTRPDIVGGLIGSYLDIDAAGHSALATCYTGIGGFGGFALPYAPPPCKGLLVAKLDGSGKVLWASTAQADVKAVAVDRGGAPHLVGVFTKTTLGKNVLDAGGSDRQEIFVARMTPWGTFD